MEKKPKGGKREGAGRKLIPIDWAKVDELLKIACTREEIAAVLEVDEDTLQNACKREKGIDFSVYIKSGIDKSFRKSLRRTQRMAAMGYTDKEGVFHPPDKIMLIWLGKQYLGQKDKTDTEQSITLRLGKDNPESYQ
jgi:hypothetical protein